METNGKSSFLLYLNFGKQLRKLSMEERGELITAIFDYAEQGKVDIELSPRADMAFSFISDVLDRDREAYAARCELNRENGKRGGRPPKKQEENSEAAPMQEHPSAAVPDNAVPSNAVPDNAAAPPFDVPSTQKQKAPEKAPEISVPEDQEYLTLIGEGMAGAYIRRNVERARRYAAKHGMTAANVLREWWLKDAKPAVQASSAPQPSQAPNAPQSSHAQSLHAAWSAPKSNWNRAPAAQVAESDEERSFFEAAMARSLNWDGT